MENQRPRWAMLAAIGVGAIAAGLMVFLVSSFVPSPGFQVAAFNWAIALAVLGAVVAAVGLAWRLLSVRQ